MRLGVLGCGKMCSAMLERWLQQGLFRSDEVVAVTRSELSASALRGRLGVEAGTDPTTMISRCDMVLVGIKPQQAAKVLSPLLPMTRPDQVWLSVLAGTRADTIARWTKGPVVRLMPNTPVRLGLGATAVVWPVSLDAVRREQIEGMLRALGEVVALQEDQIDGFTALAGSGPAYVYFFLEALEKAGVEVGLDAASARRLAHSVLKGASALLDQDARPPSALRADVTSPGGMTEAAVATLKQGRWEALMADALVAAVARGQLLAAMATEADQ